MTREKRTGPPGPSPRPDLVFVPWRSGTMSTGLWARMRLPVLSTLLTAVTTVILLTLPAACSDDGQGADASTPLDADLALDAGADGSPPADDSSTPDASPQPTLHPMSPQELHAALGSKDFLLVNVHIPDAGEIPGTDTHIPYTDVDAMVAYIGADLGVKVVIYCLTDHMALIAGPSLVQRGYLNIYYLQGGMNAWVAAGFTLDPYP